MKSAHEKLIILLSLILFFAQRTAAQTITIHNQVFKIDTLTSNLGFPWEILYGPDDSLWVTESRGYRITKVHARDGGKRTLLNLNPNKSFARPDKTGGQWPQGGLMGLALHPQLLSGKPFVYVAYVYQFDSCKINNNGCFFKTRIVQYTYNTTTHTLGSPVTIINALDGSNDHNSGRMAIGPDNKLYYTIGDMGAGQFNNLNRLNKAQDSTALEGKILRFNLEPDLAQSGGDEWIPDDNPFPATGPVTNKTPVYSWGHRNPQGVMWGNVNGTWRLYSSEHGDKSDDEVNVIINGSNYGWPKVAGLCDDNYNTYDTNQANNVLANLTVNDEMTWCNSHTNVQAMFALFNADTSRVPRSSNSIYSWPTVAPSSIDFYGSYSNTIPGWSNSLLVTSLKYGLYRLKLKSPLGDVVDSASTPYITDTIPYFYGNRVRDVAINPRGDTLYFAIDSSGSTSGPTGGFSGSSSGTQNAGRILRMVYLSTLPLHDVVPNRPVNNRLYVKVFPNPAAEVLYVQSKKGMHKPLRAQLYDITGKLVKEKISGDDNFSVMLDGMTTGTFIFKLYNGYGIVMTTEKILVK